MPIIWSGTSFKSSASLRAYGTEEISGIVSADGTTVLSLIYRYNMTNGDPNSDTYRILSETFELENLPLNYSGEFSFIRGAFGDCGKFVKTLTYHDHQVFGPEITDKAYISTDWKVLGGDEMDIVPQVYLGMAQ